MKVDYLNKTLEQLENDVWVEIDFPTNLVKRIYYLRKKILNDFTVEDLRVTIGQNTSLSYLIPLAIRKLNENIFAEGDYYPGDLLQSILSSDHGFWRNNITYWRTVKEIYNRNKQRLNADNDYKQLRKSFEEFILIHEQN